MGRPAWGKQGAIHSNLWSINRRSQSQARPPHLPGQGNVCTPGPRSLCFSGRGRSVSSGRGGARTTADQPCSNSAISRSKIACCFLSSQAMPWLSGGDRRRSMTLASCVWRPMPEDRRTPLSGCKMSFLKSHAGGARPPSHSQPPAPEGYR